MGLNLQPVPYLNPLSGVAVVAAPELQDVTIKFGALTAATRGAMKFSAIMGNSGGPVATYTVTATSVGATNHFALPGVGGVVAEGSAALSPTPNATGDAAELNSAPYTFSIQALNAGGSSTATLTLDMQADAASLGSYVGTADNFDGAVFSMTAAQFYNAPKNGRRLLIQPGTVRTSSGIGFGSSFFDFPGQVIVEYAEPLMAKPELPALTFGTGNKNIRVDDIVLSGAVGVNARLTLSGVIDFEAHGLRIGLDEDDFTVNVDGILISGDGADNIVIEDLQIRHQNSGITVFQGASNVEVRDFDIRYCHRSGIVLGPGFLNAGAPWQPAEDILFEDGLIAAPYRTPGDVGSHLDGIQQLDDFQGYTAAEGGLTPTQTVATGLTQRVRFKDVVVGIANANSGWSAFRPGRAGDASTSEDLQFENCIFTTWALNGFELSNSFGDTYCRNVAVWRSDSGDDSTAPAGARKFLTDGFPSCADFYAGGRNAANWLNAFELSNVHVYGNSTNDGGGHTSLTQSGCEFYGRNETNISADYVVNPRTSLEAISDAAYAAMTKAEMMAAHKTAFIRHDATGPVDGDGEWNTFTPPGGEPGTFDSTVTTFDSTTKTMDATS